jgi:hypothetical protein
MLQNGPQLDGRHDISHSKPWKVGPPCFVPLLQILHNGYLSTLHHPLCCPEVGFPGGFVVVTQSSQLLYGISAVGLFIA